MRYDKQTYYLEVAKKILERGTCLRRNYGSVIVKNDEIIATGYTGAPRGLDNCIDIGKCKRQELGIPPGERYELCRSVHSEANAIISASRSEMIGSTLYVQGRDALTKEFIQTEPCLMCKKMIINAGIKYVYTSVDTKEIVENWRI